MNFIEFLSYKTFYYFIYDDLNVDLSMYKEVSANQNEFTKEKGYKAESFRAIFDQVNTGTKDICILKTTKGNVVFHLYDDHDYVKNFLKQNSKNKPCGVFGSHRVADVYQIGIAENGEIKRYIYSDEEYQILEGKPTAYEKANGKKYKLDKDGYFEELLDESDVYDYAADFLPFNVETDDIEVLDFKYYEYMSVSSEVDSNIIDKVTDNLISQGVEDVLFYVVYSKKTKECYVIGLHKKDGEYVSYYTEVINSIKDKNEVHDAVNRCLNTCAKTNFAELSDNVGIALYGLMISKKRKGSSVGFFIDTEDKGALACSLTVKKGKELKKTKIMDMTYDSRNYNDSKFDKFYEYINIYMI